MEGRKNIEEFYRKLKVGTKLKYAFTTVIVTLAIAVVVSLVSIVKMNVDTYKFYKEAYANSTRPAADMATLTAHCRWKSVKIYSLWENIFCGR